MINMANLSACLGRHDDYAIQHQDGHYTRAFRPLSPNVLHAHLAGEFTIGTYVKDEQGNCRFAVFDADQEDGLTRLLDLQAELADDNIPSYIERSRRGGHLWLFFREPVPAHQVRDWLWPLAQAQGLELYPRQGQGQDIGSLIRVPLGIHRRSGRRYPFVDAHFNPVASTLQGMLDWLGTVKCTIHPPISTTTSPTLGPLKQVSVLSSANRQQSIREWNA